MFQVSRQWENVAITSRAGSLPPGSRIGMTAGSVTPHLPSASFNPHLMWSHDPMMQMAARYQPTRSQSESEAKESTGRDSDLSDGAKSGGGQNLQALKNALNQPPLVTQPWFWAHRMENVDKRSADQTRMLDIERHSDSGSSKSSSPIDNSYMLHKKLKMKRRGSKDMQGSELSSPGQDRASSEAGSSSLIRPPSGSNINNCSRERLVSPGEYSQNSPDRLPVGDRVPGGVDLLNQTAIVDQVPSSPPLRSPLNDVIRQIDQMEKHKSGSRLSPLSFSQKTLDGQERQILDKNNFDIDVTEKNNALTNGYLLPKDMERGDERLQNRSEENSSEKEAKKDDKQLKAPVGAPNGVCGSYSGCSVGSAPPHPAYLAMAGFPHMHPALMYQYNHYAVMQQQFAHLQQLHMAQAHAQAQIQQEMQHHQHNVQRQQMDEIHQSEEMEDRHSQHGDNLDSNQNQ